MTTHPSQPHHAAATASSPQAAGLPLRNTQWRYGLVAMALHWVIAVAILTMIGLGLWMTGEWFGNGRDLRAYQIHKTLGILILALSLVRLGWRAVNPVPPLPPGRPRWERLAATATHWGFYGLMIGLPVTGWLMVSASPFSDFAPVREAAWLFEVPALPPFGEGARDAAVEATFKTLHELAAWLLAATLVLHVGAALKHAVILRDGVLRRMLPLR